MLLEALEELMLWVAPTVAAMECPTELATECLMEYLTLYLMEAAIALMPLTVVSEDLAAATAEAFA